MRQNAVAILILSALAIITSGRQAQSSAVQTPAPIVQSRADAVSGDWIATFDANNVTITGELTLKLDGDRLSGSLHTEHTGSGMLTNTSFTGNWIAFHAEFASHVPIQIIARLQDGKLTGEFRVAAENMQGTWQATRKP